MALPICMGYPNFGSIERKRIDEFGASIGAWQSSKQNSGSTSGIWRSKCFKSKSVVGSQGRAGALVLDGTKNPTSFPALVLDGIENPTRFVQERVKKLVLNQHTLQANVELNRERPLDLTLAQLHGSFIPRSDLLNVAYESCRQVFVKERVPFDFGTLFMNPEKQKAFWAIWAWGRRLDELVDGFNRSHTTNEVLDGWNQSTVDAFKGRPWDIYDVALSDTASKYPLDIQLFKDLTEGTRFDMTNTRFQNFDELYLYKYYRSSTFVLMLVQTMGISSESKASLESVYHAAVNLAQGLTLTDTLRDLGEDARMGRIYLPQDELEAFGLSDEDIYRGKVTEKWRKFMKWQINRVRSMLDESASLMIPEMNADVRCALWIAMLIYRQHLEVIEANDFNTFTKKTYLRKPKMLLTVLHAYAKSLGLF